MNFDINKIDSQKGRIAIVTGANSGLGFETAKALARLDMKVVMACRSKEKAQKAKSEIMKQVPKADLKIMELDLSKLASVRAFVKAFLKSYQSLDLLINNAGVMMPPYSKTEDGFELQMAANYFGHFLLTGLLLETINKTPGARIVALSSIAHKGAKINFDDLQSEKNYNKSEAYGQSKLACLMFAFELNRRLEKANHKTLSVAAHPGVSDTELGKHIPRLVYYLFKPLAPILTHVPRLAAKPQLFAALDESVKGGEYFGPTGFNEMKGAPGRAKVDSNAKNDENAAKLFDISEDLVGYKFDL